jgi:hypothetical protein
MPTKTRRAATLACAMTLVLLRTTPALADESPGERLFREGRAQMLEGRFDEACPKIAESQRLEPHVGTLLNLAACHERQGRVGSAWVEYQKALTAARAEGQADRTRLAQERIAVLEPRVPWLEIVVPSTISAGDIVVSLDGATVQPVAWGKEMPVDPGSHVVMARAAGWPPFEQTLEIHEGGHATSMVTFAGGEPLPAETMPARVVVDPNPPPNEGASPPPAKVASRWVFEPGVFLGYMNASTDRAFAVGSVASSRCVGCSYSLSPVDGPVAGPNVFVGYAFSKDFVGGLRVLAGPRLQRGGGSIVAIGPSVSLRTSHAWSFGAWALLGSATASSNGVNGVATAPSGYTPDNTGSFTLTTSTDLGAGLGFEVSLHLLELGRGSLLLDSTPFFLAGSNGTAWVLPIGIAYRFQ